MQLIRKISTLFHPERFQGWNRNKSYFEGWYYKLISANGEHAFAFIPGIAIDSNGHKQAFVQILDGKSKKARYLKFPFEQFTTNHRSFHVKIDTNTFTLDRLKLNLDGIEGSIAFHDHMPWPSPFYSPGIMGPYTFAPFMECYHGILSMDHSISGTLRIGEQEVNFDGGRGYMEKDWGRSFPSAYIWMQTNHFKSGRVSLKASVAKIPWLTGSFVGFIAGLYLDGKLYQFTTYNQTRLLKCTVDKGEVHLQMRNRKYTLEIKAIRDEATELAAPIQGFMDGRISETMTSSIHVKLSANKNGTILFSETGSHAGLEVAGAIREITTA